MRVRFLATLLTAGALLAPAAMPAAHAVGAPVAVITHTAQLEFAPSSVEMTFVQGAN